MMRTNRFALVALLANAMFAQANPDGVTGATGTATNGDVAAAAANTPATGEATAAVADAPVLTAEQAAAAKEAQIAQIKANFNNQVDVRETSFYFRKVVNEVKDAEGKVSKIETKRPTVSIPVPVPSVEGIVAILEAGGKQLDLLLEAVAGVVVEQAREYINEHEDANDKNFPYENLSWEKIANLPKAERRGGGISKELWDDFEKDYVEIMPALTGKKKEAVEMAAKVFKTKFAGATTNKPVLKLLEQQLTIYTNNTTQAELVPCIEFLQQKLEKLLTTDETNLLLAL